MTGSNSNSNSREGLPDLSQERNRCLGLGKGCQGREQAILLFDLLLQALAELRCCSTRRLELLVGGRIRLKCLLHKRGQRHGWWVVWCWCGGRREAGGAKSVGVVVGEE